MTILVIESKKMFLHFDVWNKFSLTTLLAPITQHAEALSQSEKCKYKVEKALEMWNSFISFTRETGASQV